MKRIYLKSLLVLVLFAFAITQANAQSLISVDASSVASTFKFIESNGTKDTGYSMVVSGAYSFGFRYIANSGFMLHPRMGMQKGGATLVYDGSNYSWDLQYANLKVGAGYMMKKDRFSPYLMIAPYYGVLLSANQVLNNQNFDIKSSKAIQSSDYGIFFTPGVQLQLSENLSAYSEFNYMMGLQNLENNATGQKSYNRAISLTFGLAFTLKAPKGK